MGNGRSPFESGNHINKTPETDKDQTPLNTVDLLREGLRQGRTAEVNPAGGSTDLPIGGVVIFGDRKATEEQMVMQLAQASLNKPQATRETVDQALPADRGALREYGSDAAAISAGFLTKYGVQRMLTKAPGWGKLAGIGLGLGTAGLTKDVVNNGEIGSSSDWLRGSAVFGGSMLAARGLSSMRGSNKVLGEATTTSIENRFGVQGLNSRTSGASHWLPHEHSGGRPGWMYYEEAKGWAWRSAR